MDDHRGLCHWVSPEPDVVAERCVHSRMEQASCRACVDACPTGAWVIDADRLGIATDLCDGCALCAPACPQGAIQAPFAPACFRVDGTGLAFAGCDRAGIASGDTDGWMPCLHGLGVAGLLGLHKQGIRHLVMTRGDCATCPRGRVQRIDATIEAANAWLADRALGQIRSQVLGAETWTRARDSARGRHRAPAVGRRAFFRSIATTAIDGVSALGDRSNPLVPDFVPAGRRIPGTGPGHLALDAPRIDAQRCIGCDACTVLCPHDVIRVESNAYCLDADGCTGCGICVDVCEPNAMTLGRMVREPQTRLPLSRHRCAGCGVEFHLPGEHDGRHALCPICVRTRHHRLLFQVLDA